MSDVGWRVCELRWALRLAGYQQAFGNLAYSENSESGKRETEQRS